MYAVCTDAALCSHTTFRLLHYGCHDESVVDPRFVRNLLDRIVEVLRLLRIVVGLFVKEIAGACYYVLVRDPHLVEGHPMFLGWPASAA